MSSQTPMEDLLKPVVDEVEETAEAIGVGPSSQPEAKAAETADTKPTQPEPAKTEAAPPKEDGEEERVRRMHALPKWAHERMRANDEAAAAAQRRAAEVAAELEAERQRRAQLEAYFQQQQGNPPQYVEPAAIEQVLTERVYETRVALGWPSAVREHGEEFASHATHWAANMATANPAFAQTLKQDPDPVGFAVREFKKAQALAELEKHNFDPDALVAARMKAVAPPVVQPQPAAGDAGARKPTVTPSDFAGAPSGSAASAPQWAGPTPLGDLLKLKR